MTIVKNVAWMLAGRWVYNLTTLLSFTIIVSLISPAEFGVFTLASTFIILSDTFFSDAIENLIVRQSGDDDDIVSTLFWVTISASVTLALFVAMFAIPFGAFYTSQTVMLATQSIAVIIILQGAASVPRALLMRAGRSRQYATNSAISNLIGSLAGISTAWLGAGLWSLIIQQGVLQIAMLVMCVSASKFRPRFTLDHSLAKEFSVHVLTMLWSTVLNVAGNRLDVLVIGLWFGNTATGVYGLAKRLIQIIQDLVASSFDKILLSMLARGGNNKDNIYRSSVIMQMLAALPSFSGFAVVAPILVPIIFGKEWSGVAPLVCFMAVGGVFRSMVTIERAQQMLAGQMGRIAHIRIVELVIGVITTLPAAKFGLNAIAAVFSIRYLIGYIVVVISRVGWQNAPRLLTRTAAWAVSPLLGTALMVVAVWMALHELEFILRAEIRLVIGIGIGGVVFMGTLWGMKRWWFHHLVQV